MKRYKAGLIALTVLLSSLSALAASTARTISESKYSVAHSLGDNYIFDPRDGWQTVNVTNLAYKYKRGPKGSPQRPKSKSVLNGELGSVVNKIWEGLKGVGSTESVIITWYTGHDLLNPSCWPVGKWAPTDESFAAALTSQGWTTRPKCFKFIELCNKPQKCVFVRVVDSCAGCAAGTKHVDLTRAAFSQLANPDEGVLNVQLRQATEPDSWYEKLWGPQVKGN